MDSAPDSTLAQLLSGNPVDQLAALRRLKNDIVGHLPCKEKWVQLGALRPIVSIVGTSSSHGVANAEHDKARLQGLQILGSFANAGPSFIPPLHAAGALTAVLSDNCLGSGHPQTVLWSLRVLRDFAASTAQGAGSEGFGVTELADSVLVSGTLDIFARILAHATPSRDLDAQVFIVAYLIKKLCSEDRHQIALVNHGILDALATRLASFAVAKGQVLPYGGILGRSGGLSDYIPAPATSNASLEMVLWAISAIVTDSSYRACKLLLSPSVLATFPVVDSEAAAYPDSASDAMRLPGTRPTKQTDHDPMDYFLPFMPNHSRSLPSMRSSSPSGSGLAKDAYGGSGRPTSKFNTTLGGAQAGPGSADKLETVSDVAFEEAESPLIPWLIGLVRTGHQGEILSAVSVLASLFKAGYAYKSREHLLSVFVMPVLLNIITEASNSTTCDIDTPFKSEYRFDQLEEAPAILTQLLTDGEFLQRAAFECDAVKLITTMLKGTYDTPLPDVESRPWSPEAEGMALDAADLDASCRLGRNEDRRVLMHRIRLRENCLKALGALACFKDEYRKAIIDQDALAYIAESLSAVPGDPRKTKDRSKASEKTPKAVKEPPISGPQKNPPGVLIAASYVVRMLARSPHILRTALTDIDVTISLMQLLLYPDIKVQIAATYVTCNLVVDFSPLREPLIEEGVVPILCEQAHSSNPELRLNALWALKHVIHDAGVDFRQNCLTELGAEWLVQLICDDIEDDALYLARGRSEETDEDIDMSTSEDQRFDSVSENLYKTSSPPPLTATQSEVRLFRLAQLRLSALRTAETSESRKARHNDLAIQEQGLSLIRNLIASAHTGSNADGANDTAQMIDHLFDVIGQERLFDIMSSKLRSRVSQPLRRKDNNSTSSATRGSGNGSGDAGGRVLAPQSKLIVAVIYILVHMAASLPRHRQLVIAQTDLLRTLSKMFNSQNREVRLALCHLINNLTWQDDGSDATACSQRAVELRKLGFLTKLEALGQADDELDVREQARSALWQMKHGY
ncbi:armadillo repeat protein [Microdochium trichocladiopsis]|uniref:Armadillo repeat protein n=1 Tax=Microdochium trichocladiopsis TaxID=1682393 RepID=A0A9P8YK58_9PEZI|nr:armadillo repeat protein [Microdochium trichocladiopsis]KAH7040510.1 armadillo repeat protein [Microdochium trichocladiopsis]